MTLEYALFSLLGFTAILHRSYSVGFTHEKTGVQTAGCMAQSHAGKGGVWGGSG